MTEESESKRDGATLQKNSGRGKFAKGDAVLGRWLIDYKEYAKSFSLNMAMWAKVCQDSIAVGGKHPTLKVILGGDKVKVRLFVISEEDFHEMNAAWIEINER